MQEAKCLYNSGNIFAEIGPKLAQNYVDIWNFEGDRVSDYHARYCYITMDEVVKVVRI